MLCSGLVVGSCLSVVFDSQVPFGGGVVRDATGVAVGAGRDRNGRPEFVYRQRGQDRLELGTRPVVDVCYRQRRVRVYVWCNLPGPSQPSGAKKSAIGPVSSAVAGMATPLRGTLFNRVDRPDGVGLRFRNHDQHVAAE